MKRLLSVFAVVLAVRAARAQVEVLREPVPLAVAGGLAGLAPSALAPSALPLLSPASLPSLPAAPVSLLPRLPSLPGDAGAGWRALFDGQSLRGRGLNAVEAGSSPDASVESFAQAARRLYGDPRVVARKAVRPQGLPTDGELSDRVRMSPQERAAREQAVQDLFKMGGARPQDIVLQDIGGGAHNIMVVKPGKTGKVIVIGAHSDKVDVGQGVIDNWTGSTMVTNLYQALHDVETEHTIVFVVFGREEEGLVGSNRYVKGLTRAQLGSIDAMINLDTLGVDGTFSWQNNSDPGLLKAYRETAARTGLDLQERVLWGGDADSSSFRRKGVPAVTLFGASPEVIFDIIHSENDNFGAFNLQHYKNSFLLTKAVVESLDKQPGSPAAGAAALSGRQGGPGRRLPKLKPWWTTLASRPS